MLLTNISVIWLIEWQSFILRRSAKQNPVQSSKCLQESECSTNYLPVLSFKKLRDDIFVNKQSSRKEKSKYLILNVNNLLYLYAEPFCVKYMLFSPGHVCSS